jgi:hypothetical protein
MRPHIEGRLGRLAQSCDENFKSIVVDDRVHLPAALLAANCLTDISNPRSRDRLNLTNDQALC